MSQVQTTVLTILLLAGLLVFKSLYVVNEYEHGMLFRLGKIVTDSEGEPSIKLPGLHAMLPFIHESKIFDMRLQTLDIDESRIVTSEKKDLIVDYYVKWRIEDILLFFKRTSGGNFVHAKRLIEQKVNDSLRAEFGKRTIQEVVSGERRDIMAILSQQAKTSVVGLGLDVIDVRIKRIDLPSEVSSAVFDRMRAERQRFATEHRAEGRSKSEAIKAGADATSVVIQAKAGTQGAEIRGEGDAVAAKIYADAYRADPEFYSFYRSIEAYLKVFSNKKDILIMRPDNYFFKYFNHVLPPAKNAAERAR